MKVRRSKHLITKSISQKKKNGKKEKKGKKSPLGTLAVLLALQNIPDNTQGWGTSGWVRKKMAVRDLRTSEGPDAGLLLLITSQAQGT